uniref:Uncharacterized protein n=1 Tax=Oryza sativa subsp. japonica TaxID=39947 RepID=Q5Z785_ORYSJ|nr:hypothetical protein [Oryza sativa Japonica Group]
MLPGHVRAGRRRRELRRRRHSFIISDPAGGRHGGVASTTAPSKPHGRNDDAALLGEARRGRAVDGGQSSRGRLQVGMLGHALNQRV